MTGSADDSSRNENLRNWIVSRRKLAHKNNGKNSTEWLVQPEIQLYSMRWWTFNSLGMNFSTHWTLAPPSNSWLCHNRDLLFSHNKNFFFGWTLWGILNECCVFFYFSAADNIAEKPKKKKKTRQKPNICDHCMITDAKLEIWQHWKLHIFFVLSFFEPYSFSFRWGISNAHTSDVKHKNSCNLEGTHILCILKSRKKEAYSMMRLQCMAVFMM